MGLFRRKRAQPITEKQEKVALGISAWVLAKQSHWAARLNTLASKYPKRSILFFLVAWLIGLGLYCTYLIISTIL